MRPRDIVFVLRVISFCKTGVLKKKGHVAEKLDMLSRKERNDIFDSSEALQFVLLSVSARKVPLLGDYFLTLQNERIEHCPNLRWFVSYFSNVSRFSKNEKDKSFALAANFYFNQLTFVMAHEPRKRGKVQTFVLSGMKPTVYGDDTLRNELVRLDKAAIGVTDELRYAYTKSRSILKGMDFEDLKKYGLDRDDEK